ncbi:MAG: hypothetical protein EA428_12415 [Spirochaetaceae bacterium]|nr:MAG: hypothetical protein EA428_12415 [Spirochaetaceae bacterium]
MRSTVILVAAIYLLLAIAFIAIFVFQVPLQFRPFVAFGARYLGAILRGMPFVAAAAVVSMAVKFYFSRRPERRPAMPYRLVLGVLHPVSIVAVLLLFSARPAPAYGALVFAPIAAVLTAVAIRIVGLEGQPRAAAANGSAAKSAAGTTTQSESAGPSHMLLEESFEGLRALAVAGLFAAALHNFLPVEISTYLYRNHIPAALVLAAFWLLFPVPRGVHAAIAPLFVGRFPAVAVAVYLGLGLVLHGRELRDLYDSYGRVYTVVVVALLIFVMLLLSIPAAGLVSL